MSCQSCAYFNDKGSECRRYAPQPADNEKKASWPTVAASDWCGEYKEDDKAKKSA
ncbi:hypothetical protein HK107_04095 [Parvularcula sp. ZS-1/3]|uniref:Benzylsuccinate synthase n=1 Tax=Parvularcula mediterranea TaxID=2732508 RepID=A0A7Y3W4R7_9PROT|nr:hypothetical protein [Parvularcula mediterranea]NNU15501.1 hypothetical protein [Parvularcula mediterranea]